MSGLACTKFAGSPDFQGSSAHALWEFPQPTTSKTYPFRVTGYLLYACTNPFGC